MPGTVQCGAMTKRLFIKGKAYPLPLFFPDATLGVVRGLSSEQVADAGIKGVVINTYHLMTSPGFKVLERAGGIKKFMHWPGLTASDSGGFQLFSLIHKNPRLGKITDKGVVLYNSEKQRHKTLFTPEKSMQMQFAIGADIMICLDDFSPVDGSPTRLAESVSRTTAWAARCKLEFERLCKKHHFTKKKRPLLFAVVQGHNDHALRRQSAKELTAIGFDGYGFGGWPFDDKGDFDYQIAQVISDATPADKPRFALGVGTPANIVRLRAMGYDIFDCVLPTRDARHQRLYVLTRPIEKINLNRLSKSKPWYRHLYLDRGKLATDFSPPDQYCQCPTCRHYTKAYLHHLFKIKDNLAFQLAVTHNLWFYGQLMKMLIKLR